MKNKKEFFLIIEGYENYSVSNLGRVKNVLKNKILKEINNHKGYFEVGIYKDKKLKKVKIHQIVANLFLNKISGKEMINHINGIKTDNRVENLEWVSNRENCCHKSKLKTSSSLFIGVHYSISAKKWISQININRKSKHLGSFETEEEAYLCRVNFEKSNSISNKYL